MTDDPRPKGIGLGLPEEVDQPLIPDVARVVESAPVKEPQTLLEWIKVNLFSGPFNSILTVVSLFVLLWALKSVVDFVFIDGDWHVIRVKFRAYMTGRFPFEEVWRIWTSLYLVTLLSGASLGSSNWRPRLSARALIRTAVVVAGAVWVLGFVVESGLARLLVAAVPMALGVGYAIGRVAAGPIQRVRLWAWILAFPAILVIVRGFDGVPPSEWGGFFFNIIAAVVGIVFSFPIGIGLAIGRRSSLPAVRLFCVVVIEIFRGAPLVAWLIFAKYGLDLLLPPQLDPADIIKAFVMMTMFSAAYVAEIVRGGLQGVDAGQFEAARAIGLSTSRMMALIVLPQALRSTIPAMIGHFISLFKDTALFTAIEVTELLAAASRLGLEFLGKDAQTLMFAALLFWMVAFSMSRWSQRLEVRLGVGVR